MSSRLGRAALHSLENPVLLGSARDRANHQSPAHFPPSLLPPGRGSRRDPRDLNTEITRRDGQSLPGSHDQPNSLAFARLAVAR
jgi:hypothetical protein